MHVYELFITPDELRKMCLENDLQVECMRGFEPDMLTSGFWKLIFTRTITPSFKFHFTSRLTTGYCGYARRTGEFKS
jgi:hypothetical protein